MRLVQTDDPQPVGFMGDVNISGIKTEAFVEISAPLCCCFLYTEPTVVTMALHTAYHLTHTSTTLTQATYVGQL